MAPGRGNTDATTTPDEEMERERCPDPQGGEGLPRGKLEAGVAKPNGMDF